MATRRHVTSLVVLTALAVCGCRPQQDAGGDRQPASQAEKVASTESAAASAATTALVVTDDLGRTVRLPAPARRIACLSPSLTEILFAVGCGDSLVLRDAWSDFPIEARRAPAVEGLLPSAEAMIAARPDLLLTTFPSPALRTALRASNIPFAAFVPATLAQVADAFVRVGRVCGQPGRARAARDRFVAETERIKAAVKGRKRPRVFYEMDAGAGRPFTVGRGSFGHDLVEAAGGANVFGDTDRPWLQVSAESIVAADPEVIVLADAGAEQNPQRPDQVAGRAGWHVLAAVRNGRIHALHSDWVARPGPRLVLGLRQLADALHPGVVEPPPSEQATP